MRSRRFAISVAQRRAAPGSRGRRACRRVRARRAAAASSSSSAGSVAHAANSAGSCARWPARNLRSTRAFCKRDEHVVERARVERALALEAREVRIDVAQIVERHALAALEQREHLAGLAQQLRGVLAVARVGQPVRRADSPRQRASTARREPRPLEVLRSLVEATPRSCGRRTSRTHREPSRVRVQSALGADARRREAAGAALHRGGRLRPPRRAGATARRGSR